LLEAAEKISKSLKSKIKFARIWGPSSKFSGQTVGPEHILKDKDIIEIRTS
jgi:ribosome-interacting GTPase 1